MESAQKEAWRNRRSRPGRNLGKQERAFSDLIQFIRATCLPTQGPSGVDSSDCTAHKVLYGGITCNKTDESSPSDRIWAKLSLQEPNRVVYKRRKRRQE
ncbi:hypothetical protein COP2_018469 [Malus domestica]